MCAGPKGVAATLLALAGLMAPALLRAAADKPVPVLCLAARDARAQGLTDIDAGALARYREAGFALSFGYYEEAQPETLRRFPLVVGMLSQLHQGTSVFKGPFGGAVEAYMRAGGSFLFFSGPSYYGAADFDVMQNPFLARFGAELLKEVPRAAEHERRLPRSVGYRLLRTEDVRPSPYTGGAQELFLPLDYTDAYVRTHTAQFSDDWQVLVTAGAAAASYPHAAWLKGERRPGRWASRPPVLAVRRVGAGRFALFTTSSEYFVWEACHPAFGDGFVLDHDGMRLMSALLGRLADGSAFGGDTGAAEPEALAGEPVSGEEVSVFTGKRAWRRYALERFTPRGSLVRSYVDCGALSDLPYTADRGRGVADAAEGELVRSPGKEIFHPTAANARGVGQRPVTYRFGRLDPGKPYALGMLLWSVDAGVGRDLAVAAGGVARTFALPALQRREGPRFVRLENLAPDASGVLDAVFTCGAGGTGSFSAIGEIWLYEPGARTAADDERLFETCDALCDGSAVRFRESRCWKGLVGARSPADGGEPVERLAAAARSAGLDFLVYTDPADAHDAVSYARLREACGAASDDGFAVLAGLSFADGYRANPSARLAPERAGRVNAYVFQPLTALPERNDYGNPQGLFWKFFGGAFSGGREAAPTFSHAGADGIQPWFQRFWRGFDVMTFGNGPGPAHDARALYADLAASGYGPQPRVSGVYRNAKDIVAARGAGWLTLSSAPSLAAVATHAHMTHASSGPQILAFQAADDFYNAYGAGGGLVFGEPGWFVLNLQAAHTGALARVTLYANRAPVRRWFPEGSRFEAREPVRLLAGAEYRLHVEARDGSEALSARFQAVSRAFATSMCADNQNTITTVFKAPSRFVFDERELYLQHMYWHTGEDAGQLGVMLDASSLVPRVEETGVVQPCKYFHPCPRFTFRDGAAESHQAAELRIEESSPDVALVRYSFARPGAAFRSETVLTAYRPPAGGATAVFVETEIQASRRVSPEEIKEIALLDIALRPDFEADWRYSVSDAAGREHASGAFAELAGGKRAEYPFRAGGMAGVWPHAIANLFVGSCDAADKTIAFELGEGGRIMRERMTVRLRPRGFERGERMACRQLVLLLPGSCGAAPERRALQVRSLAPAAGVRMLSGTLEEAGPAIRCRAGPGYSAAGTCVAAGGRRDPIPLDVSGVCPQWTLAVEDASGLRLTGCGSEVLRTVVAPAEGALRFAAGNPLIADKADLRIEVDAFSKRRVRFLAHNPTPETLRCEVRANPDFASAPVFRTRVEVPPGASVWHDSALP